MKILASFSEPEPAYVAKGLLEGAGMKVFLDDARFPEEKVIVLRVHEKFLAQGVEILADRPDLNAQLSPAAMEIQAGNPAPATLRKSLVGLFVQGGLLFNLAYFAVFLILLPLGGRLPLRPGLIVLLFVLGGLSALIILGGQKTKGKGKTL